QPPVPALSISRSTPRWPARRRNTTSAVGERQMLPEQTKQIRTRPLWPRGRQAVAAAVRADRPVRRASTELRRPRPHPSVRCVEDPRSAGGTVPDIDPAFLAMPARELSAAALGRATELGAEH